MLTSIVWILVAIILAYIAFKYVQLMYPCKNAPPTFAGVIPFFGVAKDFQLDYVSVLRTAQKLYGDIFTVIVAGRRMTFLTNVKHFDMFFGKERDAISFDHGVQEFTARVFKIEPTHFFEYHGKLLTTMRNHFSPANLVNHVSQLAQHIQLFFMQWHVGMPDLFEATMETLFWSSLHVLFAERIGKLENKLSFASPDRVSKDKRTLYHYFREMDREFEMGASGMIPDYFIPKFAKGRDHLLQNFVNNVNTTPDKNFVIELLSALNDEDKLAANWSLASLWASQANSLPMTFWTLCFVMSNDQVRTKLLQELDTVQFEKHENGTWDIDYDNMQKLPYLKACVQETMRLLPPGMVTRKMMQNFPITTSQGKTYTIPKGDAICVSIYLTHHDEQHFERPNEFIPERFLGMQKIAPFTYLPFGRGPNECPGRQFALQEMLVFVCLFFKHYPNATINKVPMHDLERKVGATHPKTPTTITW